MPRSKTPIVSLEEARVRFEEWRTNVSVRANASSRRSLFLLK
jgi:hypothetical protein